MQMLSSDPIAPIEPFILVCIGYCGEDARRTLAVRARDLLPPGEPLPEGAEQSMRKIVAMGPAGRTAVPAGATTIDGRGKFLMPGLAEMHAHVPPRRALPEHVRALQVPEGGIEVARGVRRARRVQFMGKGGGEGVVRRHARTLVEGRGPVAVSG